VFIFWNCLRSNFRRELHRLSPPKNGRSPPFPIHPTQDRLTFWLSGMRDRQSMQGSTQVRTVQTGMYRLSRIKHRYTLFGSEDVRGFFCRSQTPSLLAVRESHGGGTPNTVHLGLLLHAPGLTLVTHATACIPSACVPSTIWKITCPSKRT
jgi:hypothetical protein